jgi:hypothetical protein
LFIMISLQASPALSVGAWHALLEALAHVCRAHENAPRAGVTKL